MAEYIERANIKYEQWSVGPLNEPLMVVRKKTIDSIPTADVAPVVRGRWDLLDDAGSKIVKWNCDKCNRISTSKTDYCPNCGARMEESESK